MPNSAIDIYKTLRLCLKTSGLDAVDWLWLAEAEVYTRADPDIAADGQAFPQDFDYNSLDAEIQLKHIAPFAMRRWCPLLGKKRQSLDGAHEGAGIYFDVWHLQPGSHRPPWYEELVSATYAAGKKHESVSNFIEVIKNAAKDQQVMNNQLAPVPQTAGQVPDPKIPGFDWNHELSQQVALDAYAVAKRRKYKDAGMSFTIYPNETLLVGIPISAPTSASGRLLALTILFAELPQDDQRQAFYQELAERVAMFRSIAGLQLQALWSTEIEGYFESTDPVVSLVHPALRSARHRELCRLDHDPSSHPLFPKKDWKLFGFGAASDAKALARSSMVEEVILWSTRAFCPPEDRLDRWACPDKAQWTAEDLARLGQLAPGATGCTCATCTVFALSSYHRWIKALYGHQRGRAGRYVEQPDRRALGVEHIAWLEKLLGAKRIPPAPNLAKYYYNDGGTCPEGDPFLLPVEPGVRLLIPWLALVRQFKQEHFQSSESFVLVKKPNCKEAGSDHNGQPRLLCNYLDEFTDRHALILIGHWKGDDGARGLAEAVRAYRRHLSGSAQRAGNDATALLNVQRGHLGDEVARLEPEESDRELLFRPLAEGGAAVHVDLEFDPSANLLLIAAAWGSGAKAQ